MSKNSAERKRSLLARARYSKLMWQERVRRYLLPGAAEQDSGFREEIIRLSRIGLQVVGGVDIGVSLFMMVAHFVVTPDPNWFSTRFTQGLAIICVGFLSLLSTRVKALHKYSRTLAVISGISVAAILIWFSLLRTVYESSADDFIPGEMTLIMMVAIAAVPLRPTDTLLLGFILEACYVLLTLAAQAAHHVPSGVLSPYFLFIFMLTLLATGLTAVVYEQRRSTYSWHLRSLRAAEELRQAEGRNLLSQNAASVGRLAAALSHEINSPIGALVSGVDTLLLLASRQATAPPSDHQRLVLLQSELRKSIKLSTDRLKEIVTRMQRFTNLDRAEVQSANVNDILSDVAALLEPQYKEKAQVNLQLKPVPDMICRPQQLSAVFSNVLLNSIDATTESGQVTVATESRNQHVDVRICDNGRGLQPSEIENIFDPGFKVTQGRVSTGNWSMFSSRQIVQEHGGDIHIESKPGEGTCVTVSLPCSGCGGMEKPT